MGSVFRKQTTRPLPAKAQTFTRSRKPTAAELAADPARREIVERFARWTDRRGTKRTAKLTAAADGTPRIVERSGTWFAKYRDGAGRTQTVSTGAKTEAAARIVLAELMRRAERVRSGVATPAEDSRLDYAARPIGEHFTAYLRSLELAGVSAAHIANTRSHLTRVAKALGFANLGDASSDRLESWLSNQSPRLGPTTRNRYRSSWAGFGQWAVDRGRLAENPFRRIPIAQTSTDVRRKRRALTVDEIQRLLFVARWRPLAELGRETVPADPSRVASGSRWSKRPLSFDTLPAAVDRARSHYADRPVALDEADRIGCERELVYRVLLFTGLRRAELSSLTWGQLELDSDGPSITLTATAAKNRRETVLPIRADLAARLRQHREGLAQPPVSGRENDTPNDSEADQTRKRVRTRSGGLKNETRQLGRIDDSNQKVFPWVGRKLVCALRRDLAAAGIPQTDDRGRVVDVHALRHTFGTMLSVSGVLPRIAQHAMRHADIGLTMNVYTDPKLLDTRAAVESLPELQGLPFAGAASPAGQPANASPAAVAPTVALPAVAPAVAPIVAPTASPDCHENTPIVSLGNGLFLSGPFLRIGRNPDSVRKNAQLSPTVSNSTEPQSGTDELAAPRRPA